MQILNPASYSDALTEFEALAVDQSANRPRLLELRDAIHAYEIIEGDEPPLPTTFADRLQLEMYKLRMRQKQFAQLLEVPESRMSEYLRGKREPNLDLVKRVHNKLKIPGDELLALI